ncbi:hypothetical protein PMAYCL1PPCAC_17846, partial [Pristionchus mayeri]
SSRMSKPPTVSELVSVGISAIVVPPTHGEAIRPDFDTDVLWKPVRLGNRMRTTSMESTESADSRRASIGESTAGEVPTGRARKLSFSEMIFGSPGKGGFSWGQGNLAAGMAGTTTKKESITDDERFKELLKRESNVLNDEGTFSRKNYFKS